MLTTQDQTEILAIILGVFIGVLITLSLMILHPKSSLNMRYSAIYECEKDLPRTQHCTIIGVPKNVKPSNS